jgi:hypothetical protein
MTLGEVSPNLYARQDFDGYYKGLKIAKNVLINLQGGIGRRFGTEYISNLNTTKVSNEISMFTFKIGILSVYTLLLQENTILIYYERNLIASIDNPYTVPQIKDVKFTQVGNSVLMFHEDVPPKEIARSASSPIAITGTGLEDNTLQSTSLPVNIGAVAPVSFSSILGALPELSPKIDNSKTYFIRAITGNDFSVYSTPTDARLDENRFQVIDSGTNAFMVPLNSWDIVDFVFKNQPTVDYNKNYYDRVFSFTIATGQLQATTDPAASPIFTDEHLGGIVILPITIDVDRIVGRIEQVVNENTVILEGDWTGTNASDIPGSDLFIREVAFSELRGWPKSGDIFQNRLVLGGSKSLPGNIWLSVTNNEEDFDDSDADDDASISISSSKNSGFITYPFSTRTLITLTNSGVYSTPLLAAAAITPRTAGVDEQSDDGSEDVLPVNIDNQIVFASTGGRAIRSIFTDTDSSTLLINNISVTAAHLIRNPISVGSLKNSTKTDANYALFINQDGTMAIFTSLREQSISGWTQVTTDGKFRQVSSIDGDVYLIIEREIDGELQLMLEVVDFDCLMDCCKKFTFDENVSTISGLSYIENKEVNVIADGYRSKTIVENGQIQLDMPAKDIEVGLNFTVQIDPLNFSIPDAGVNFYEEKTNKNIYIDYFESYSISLNGELIPELNFTNETVNEAPTVKSGVYKWSPMTGPSIDLGISITQDEPYPFTLRGIGYEVSGG